MKKVILAFLLASSCFAMKPVPTVPRVGFRVEGVEKDKVVLRPIYPVKLGGEILEGQSPVKGEMLTCNVQDEEVELKDGKGKNFFVHRMVLYCLSGQKIVVIGVEY